MNERQKRYNRRESAAAADIGEIPVIVDVARRESCRLDLHRFLCTYFPATTGMKPLSDDHKRAIGRIQRCALQGGRFLNVFPRGFAKTTIGENSVIWVVLYGHRKFAPLFGATADDATGMIESIKTELTENDLLMDDFPEVCHAIRALEGKPQRCHSQSHSLACVCPECDGSGTTFKESANGSKEATCSRCKGTGESLDAQLTHIEWTSDQVVLPTVRVPIGWATESPDPVTHEQSRASGAIITTRGITGGARGMKHKRPDGTQQRPDFVVIDDPQTDESAASPSQVRKRLGVLKKSILKLGGHNGQIAVVMNATVIEKDDLIDQLADPKRNPSWQSERIKMVRHWSDEHDGLWKQYAEIRNSYDEEDIDAQQRARKAATEFYAAHRTEMDKGSVVTWQYCYDPGSELSAIQHAYNSLIDDGPEVFASECQNEPLIPDEAKNRLTASQVKAKASVGLARGTIPLAGTRIVCHIDVQKESLWWSVYSGSDDFLTHLVDSGTWPKQPRAIAGKRDLIVKLSDKYPGMGPMGAITQGLRDLTDMLDKREFIREGDGSRLRIERGGVDSRWGESSVTVKRFIREKGGIWMAVEGQYFGPADRPLAEYKKQTGEIIGNHWILKTLPAGRVLKVDVNFYKSFVDTAIRAAVGDKGSMTLFGKPTDHDDTAEQLANSEFSTRVESKGREMDIWKLIPGRDNERLDNAVGCCALLSYIGCDLMKGQFKTTARRKINRPKVTYI